MNWNFIFVDFAFITIWLTSLLGFAPKINKYTKERLPQFFSKIENYKGKINKELFEKWISEYYFIINTKGFLKNMFYFGIILIIILFISSFIKNELYAIFLYITDFILGVAYFLSLSTIISWYIGEVKE